ncbi:MAG TPA: two-component system activity regulator YycH [Pseudogracilibacillus sp.]|nr:two-component system activity regulator YycH [Pseudogracilibacillus sp.]
MNGETVKSFILFILVMISLLLSLLVWNYQPSYETLYDPSYVGEVDVGGSERTKSDLIAPAKILFHFNEETYAFNKASERLSFFKDLQQWNVYDYDEVNLEEGISTFRSVEIKFHDAIPLEYVEHIFNIEEELNYSDSLFDTIVLQMDDENQSLNVIIPNEKQSKAVTAKVEKMEHYQQVAELIYEQEQLMQLHAIDLPHKTIYVSKEEYKMPRKTLVATELNPELFVNALFRNPSLVTQNRMEAVFTDGQRGMRILNDGKTLEYTNPIQSSEIEESPMELIDYTISNVNDHKGWTNDFQLSKLEQAEHRVTYRLAYDGYPVYDFYNISEMVMERRSQELYEYDRSLIKLGNTLNSVNVTLMSGEEIEQFLSRESIDLSEVRDITIGYYLSNIDKHSYVLEPSWFILYDDTWRRVTKEENASSAVHEEVG